MLSPNWPVECQFASRQEIWADCFWSSRGSEKTRGALGSLVKNDKALKCCQSPRQQFCRCREKNVSVSSLQFLCLSESEFKQLDQLHLFFYLKKFFMLFQIAYHQQRLSPICLHSSRGGLQKLVDPAGTRDLSSEVESRFAIDDLKCIIYIFGWMLKVWFYMWSHPGFIITTGLFEQHYLSFVIWIKNKFKHKKLQKNKQQTHLTLQPDPTNQHLSYEKVHGEKQIIHKWLYRELTGQF